MRRHFGDHNHSGAAHNRRPISIDHSSSHSTTETDPCRQPGGRQPPAWLFQFLTLEQSHVVLATPAGAQRVEIELADVAIWMEVAETAGQPVNAFPDLHMLTSGPRDPGQAAYPDTLRTRWHDGARAGPPMKIG
jgi:hypothetical protein